MFRIAAIDAFAVAVPLKAPVRMSRVTIETCDNLMVRIVDGSGRIGWGEAPAAPTVSGETTEGMIAAVRFMANLLVGRDVESADSLESLVDPLMYGNNGAKSAIDMALMDLTGQHRGLALHELLGERQRDRAAMIWMVAGTPDEIQVARRRRDEGYIAFKVKVGTHDPETDLGRAHATRAAVGAGVRVSADANQGFDPADALVFARGAGDAGLDFFEQPVMGNDVESMRACAAACAVPIGADEGLHSMADIQRHHDLEAAAGGSLKLIKFGGIGRMMEAGRLMQRLGMHINLAGKAANTSIGASATAHLALVLPNLDWDASISSTHLADDVVTHPVAVADGHIVTPSDGSGLGITMDEEKLARYRRH